MLSINRVTVKSCKWAPERGREKNTKSLSFLESLAVQIAAWSGFRGPWCSQVGVVWTLFVLKASTGRRVAKGTPWETDKPPLIGPACC